LAVGVDVRWTTGGAEDLWGDAVVDCSWTGTVNGAAGAARGVSTGVGMIGTSAVSRAGGSVGDGSAGGPGGDLVGGMSGAERTDSLRIAGIAERCTAIGGPTGAAAAADFCGGGVDVEALVPEARRGQEKTERRTADASAGGAGSRSGISGPSKRCTGAASPVTTPAGACNETS
jgi:hypothetical protein